MTVFKFFSCFKDFLMKNLEILKIYFLLFAHVCPVEDTRSLGTGVIGSCKVTDVGANNRT